MFTVEAIYYLLLKKHERDTGKNLVFERVTKEKRSYHSTGNLKNDNKNGLKTQANIPRGFS